MTKLQRTSSYIRSFSLLNFQRHSYKIKGRQEGISMRNEFLIYDQALARFLFYQEAFPHTLLKFSASHLQKPREACFCRRLNNFKILFCIQSSNPPNEISLKQLLQRKQNNLAPNSSILASGANLKVCQFSRLPLALFGLTAFILKEELTLNMKFFAN